MRERTSRVGLGCWLFHSEEYPTMKTIEMYVCMYVWVVLCWVEL